ncbi:Gfo/Idh/MocA family oxidoreductase [Dehalococcoidia bacterium]|nr:Gfo/Idh/MocA family oxidoreductase [Dehalococcoidia bacterium]
MNSKSYRIGIVGASEITAGAPQLSTGPLANEVIPSHAASLALIPEVEVAGICDLVPELLDQFKGRWERHWPGLALYTDYKEMLSDLELDIVVVATPDHLHASVVEDSAVAGVKGIFCEKPFATTIEDADRMIKVCEENSVILSVNHTRRWSPLYREVFDSVCAGSIGALGTIVATLGGERALLFRVGTHLIDMGCFFADSSPEKVFASLEDGFENWDRYQGKGGRDASTEPGASGLVQFANGVRMLYSGVKGTAAGVYFHLSGTEGQIDIDDSDRTAELVTRGAGGLTALRRNLIPGQFQVHGMVAAYREIINLIENGGTGISSGQEARKTIQIVEGFVQSNYQGGRLIPVPR